MRRTRWFGSWKFVESDLPRKLAVHNKEIWRIKRQVDLSNCNDSSSMIIQLNRNEDAISVNFKSPSETDIKSNKELIPY